MSTVQLDACLDLFTKEETLDGDEKPVSAFDDTFALAHVLFIHSTVKNAPQRGLLLNSLPFRSSRL